MYMSYNGYQFHLSADSDSIRSDPDASRNFNIPDDIEALRRLKRLQVQGFGVPQYAIDRLQQEINERNYPES